MDPLPISGYILAGGRSSRMGQDKALISLAGRPLIEHAVIKLRRLCADVYILSNDPALATFAPTVPDIHPNCGPLGGIEAALAHTSHNWNLFLPVDMPLLPTRLLWGWAFRTAGAPFMYPARRSEPGVEIRTFGDRTQPGLSLIHRDIAPVISECVQRGELSLFSAFEEVGRQIPSGFRNRSLLDFQTETEGDPDLNDWDILSDAQVAAKDLWFLNLNTREDLALAEANAAALDT